LLSLASNVPQATHIHTLSLHDALPISRSQVRFREARKRNNGRVGLQAADRRDWTAETEVAVDLIGQHRHAVVIGDVDQLTTDRGDRKSTRLNSSHVKISYAVFCLKKKR